jgi:hypothetical protein
LESKRLGLNIFIQPLAANVIDPDPSRGVAGYINDEQLVIKSQKRFKTISYFARRIRALHNPDGFEVMPPSRSDHFDKVVI